MTPSDHAARAPSEAAKTSAAEIWAMFEVRGPGTLMGPNETLLAAWLDAFARAARKRGIEDVQRDLDLVLTDGCECGGSGPGESDCLACHVYHRLRALAQEEAP